MASLLLPQTVYVNCEGPLSNRKGDLQQQSATYNAVLIFLPRDFNPQSHLASGYLNMTCPTEIAPLTPVDW